MPVQLVQPLQIRVALRLLVNEIFMHPCDFITNNLRPGVPGMGLIILMQVHHRGTPCQVRYCNCADPSRDSPISRLISRPARNRKYERGSRVGKSAMLASLDIVTANTGLDSVLETESDTATGLEGAEGRAWRSPNKDASNFDASPKHCHSDSSRLQ